MKILTSEYIKSAPSLKECPDLGGIPEFALVGRSNVGKSSFINSMTRRKNLARTSNTPGKTRYINYYSIAYEPSAKTPPKKLLFVDLPGYGYAKVSHSEQEHWRIHLENFLAKRESLQGVIQMVDARHGPQPNDVQMYEWLQFKGKRVQVVMTKCDKMNRSEQNKHIVSAAKKLDISPTSIQLYSAESHMGRDAA